MNKKLIVSAQTYPITPKTARDKLDCIARMREALKAVQGIMLRNRALGLCQGSEYVYLLKKIDEALSDPENDPKPPYGGFG